MDEKFTRPRGYSQSTIASDHSSFLCLSGSLSMLGDSAAAQMMDPLSLAKLGSTKEGVSRERSKSLGSAASYSHNISIATDGITALLACASAAEATRYDNEPDFKFKTIETLLNCAAIQLTETASES